MYTPEEISIDHPSYFDKCLIDSKIIKEKIPCRKQDVSHDRFESSIISYVLNALPLAGTLHEDSRGFIYLDIVNEYITSVIPFFNDSSLDMPNYFSGKFSKGAHISIVGCYEEKKMYNPLPIGEAFSFYITGCFKASLSFDLNNKYVWYFTIESRELNELRTSIGLGPTLNNESFYITVAYKKNFLSLNDLMTESSSEKLSLSDSEILINKLNDKK